MSSERQSLGRRGELAARDFLLKDGYRILDMNVRTPYGEIDIVAQQDEACVFVEVKTRASPRVALPEASVTPRKQAILIAAAESYLQEHPNLPESARIDVVAILMQPGRTPQIVHYENAVA